MIGHLVIGFFCCRFGSFQVKKINFFYIFELFLQEHLK